MIIKTCLSKPRSEVVSTIMNNGSGFAVNIVSIFSPNCSKNLSNAPNHIAMMPFIIHEDTILC